MQNIGYYTNSRSEVYDKLILDIEFLRIMKATDQSISMLELGSGSGAFFQNFDANKIDYTGVDNTQKAVTIGKDKNLNIVCRNWDVFLKENKRKFDVLVINDFMEHVDDHSVFLKKAYEAIVPGGIIIGSVPNLRFSPVLINLLIKRDFKYHTHGVLDETHLRFFTKRSLSRSLTENNFKISSLSMLNKIKSKSFKDFIALVASFLLGTDSKFQQIFFVGVK